MGKTVDEKLMALAAHIELHAGQLLAHSMLIAALIKTHPDKHAALAAADAAIEVAIAQAVAQSKSEFLVDGLLAAKASLTNL